MQACGLARLVWRAAALPGCAGFHAAALERLLIARGASKALRVRAQLARYVTGLDAAVGAHTALVAALEAAVAGGCDGVKAVEVVARKHLHGCAAALEVLRDTRRWMTAILTAEADGRQLFDCGDGVSEGRAAACVPAEFRPPALLGRFAAVERAHAPAMAAHFAAAGWPPAWMPYNPGLTLRGEHGCRHCAGLTIGLAPTLWGRPVSR